MGWRCSGVEEKNSYHISDWNTSAKRQELTDKKRKTKKIGHSTILFNELRLETDKQQ